ncbi:MAG: serine/threonine protein kinase, partial [Acidobacteriota bacterium]|nr:serine/threonine protein kinase [Acidobacteriota bacterium]
MSLAPATRVGPYEIVAPLGAGGMGEVYRAKDARLGREVAIKVLPHEFARDPERLRRFEQEARALGALNHPNIVAIYDIGIHDEAPYVASELLEGESLRTTLLQAGALQAGANGKLPIRKVLDFAKQIACGLAGASAKGLVHRDLKPDNIFVLSDGRVKILDFGLAKQTAPPASASQSEPASVETVALETSPGLVLGTVGYMSPEQVRGHGTDSRSDIFGFGCVLYEMLAGRRAFQGSAGMEVMSAILRDDPLPIADLNPHVPAALEAILCRCLEKNPEQRFQSAADLAFALEALSGSSSDTFSGIRRALPSPAAKSRKRLYPA